MMVLQYFSACLVLLTLLLCMGIECIMNSVSHISFLESLTVAFKSSVAIITLARGRWRLTCFDMRKLPPIDARIHTCNVMHAVILRSAGTV